MIRPPSKTEWGTSGLSAERRAYLDAGLSFEKITTRVIESATVISSCIEPYRNAPRGERDGRQIIFVVRTSAQLCDLLYNAPDGMRGRYWQSPDLGFTATKHLIEGLLPKLMSDGPPAPPEHCAPMNADDITASLKGLSAKVWPRERDDGGTPLWIEDRLKVLRWEQSEQLIDGKGRSWRRSFTSDDLEIKGALIGADQTEYIPASKRDRSCQIHKFGFT
ncbi:hypothetical protein [Bradyrhizobium canariense]|uniref:hypothetical protein n=1 Tax=Bradyrhizobium canariense TaxID=255045 RepID=UPI000A195020|nr:hypothetical protein [Bradyrhizobium canariense]OSI21193.1 hypothetical protein BST65_32065 [Bradyrhizobium canariense]OSI28953.1 hypothetical protein BST66_27875 [Bradyrhizobium canariense]OSI40039.1 hypothetical protein BSZ20_27330 [Bradyrhizobium canariense]OSI45057.1 hypothetical protein BST67_30320 [Bradyrhizobium canariense]OSI50377.1 hypothetical protein BSZ15_32680 [Bradyrhizobium canariense]